MKILGAMFFLIAILMIPRPVLSEELISSHNFSYQESILAPVMAIGIVVAFRSFVSLSAEYPKEMSVVDGSVILVSGNNAKPFAYLLGPSMIYNVFFSKGASKETRASWNLWLLFAGASAAVGYYDDLSKNASLSQEGGLKMGVYNESLAMMYTINCL
jgi:hypothetical protein